MSSFYTPWLIHRANLTNGKIRYQMMDHAEYNKESVATSLRRLSTGDQEKRVFEVTVDRRKIGLSIIGPAQAYVGVYEPYLQVMANNQISLKEGILMKKGIIQYLAEEKEDFDSPDTWHDLMNDIIFSCHSLADLEAAVMRTTEDWSYLWM
jgi:hypothetical protein